jgi:ORF6N domain
MTKHKIPTSTAPVTHIAHAILVLRRQRAILDADLASLYGVTTKRLNEQVKRNAERFPEDFLFRLTAAQTDALNRSHFATGSQKHRDRRFPPFAFTEHGAILSAIRELTNPPVPKRRGMVV